jgi:hypothetical protein
MYLSRRHFTVNEYHSSVMEALPPRIKRLIVLHIAIKSLVKGESSYIVYRDS